MSRRPSWTTKTIADPTKPIEPIIAAAAIDEEWEVPSAEIAKPEPIEKRPILQNSYGLASAHVRPSATIKSLPQAWGEPDEWKAKTTVRPNGRIETTILRVSCCPNDCTIDEWCDEMDTALMDRYERRAFLESKQT